MNVEEEIAELWTAISLLNENCQILARSLNKMNNRLRLQEATSAAHEMNEVRAMH